jgi:hypothetical protein
LQVVEPTTTDYERSQDIRVANNNKKMQELGLLTLAAEFTKSVPETSAAKKGGRKTHSEDSDSDSSEYLLDNDDQGDSEDDDDTESDELPEPKKFKVIILSP